MESEDQSEPAAKPRLKRRWFQYSTRALLVVVTVLGVTLGIIGWRAEQQRRAVAAIKAMDGGVLYADWDTRHAKSWAQRWLPRDWVEDVVGVIYYRNDTTDADLAHLQGLTEVEELAINCPKITDRGLVYLRGLTAMKMLDLSDTQISDAGLLHLKGLTALEFLWLSGTQVTDAGVAELQQVLPNCTITPPY